MFEDIMFTPEPPIPYSFVGTDGEEYIIGPTPREFEAELMTTMEKMGHIGTKSSTMKEFIDLWDRWIWMHTKNVEGQRELSVEDIKALYFVEDRAMIIQHILQRFTDSLAVSKVMFDVMADGVALYRAMPQAQDEVADADQESIGTPPVQ